MSERGKRPAAGSYDKERLGRLFRRMLAQLVGGLTMRDLRNGRRYRQQYHFVIALPDGKIASVREYLDTQHAFDVWMRTPSSRLFASNLCKSRQV